MKREATTHEGLFERLFGSHGLMTRKDRVREYIVHRTRKGARLDSVLKEEYVRRNCDQDELNEIVRDPRLIREEREALEHYFADGDLSPMHALRRR